MAEQTQPSQYKISAIRNLLREAFTAKDLLRFCQNHPDFSPIIPYFEVDASLEAMIDMLIRYCEVRTKFPRLLAEIRKERPRAYLKHRSEILSPATPDDTVGAEPTWRDLLQQRMRRTITIVKQPAMWQEVTWKFLAENRVFLLVLVVLQVALAAVYFRFQRLYLLPLWVWGLSAVLLAAAAWGWYTWGWRARTWPRLALTLLLTLSLAGVVFWQVEPIVFPEPFSPQVFGMAVAELGEGADFQHTARAREISAQVYEHLCRALAQDLSGGEGYDPCGAKSETSEAGPVALRRIGVIPDSRTAEAYGERIGAEIVIWGQVLTASEGGASIRFQVLETPDRAIDPDTPLVLPVTATSAEVFARELDLESDPVKLKQVVASQSTVISSFTLGMMAYLHRDYPQAMRHLETTVRTVESSPSMGISPNGMSLLYFYLGKVNHALGRIETGQDWLTLAHEANPNEPAIPLSIALGHGSLGETQERENRLTQSLALIRNWLQTHPGDTAALYDRGIIHHIRDQYDDAILDYEAVIERNPDYYIAYISLGQVAAEAQRYEQAEEALRAAIALAERTGAEPAWAYLNLALVYESAGKPRLAKPEFQTAIQHEPESAWMYYFYARFLERQQEMDAALIAYRSMVDVAESQQGWAYEHLAGFLARRGLWEQAVENYKRALHYQPDDALLHAHLAETFVALGDMEQAVQAYEEAVKYGPNLYYVYASYGWLLFQQGEWERAAEMFKSSLSLRPVDYAALMNLARTYEMMNQMGKAKELYDQVLGLTEDFTEDERQAARERLQGLSAASP